MHDPIFFILKGDPEIKGGHLPRGTKQMRGIYVDSSRNVHSFPRKSLKASIRFYSERLEEYKPAEPIAYPIRLKVAYAFKIGKPKKLGWKLTAPDTDNLIKVLKDEMTHAGYWKDDAQVVFESCGKFITNQDEAYIAVLIEDAGEPLDDPRRW